ncbi:hypothetical protein GUJ93_ZPchr0010g7998 [Zizania palustris]|uniref:Uncharacterized protein n=1 Tax=Zizania palustris TaxID=103762 RepID=A0A8J5VVY3_ZIZPA|nr:hypothetical protein GUJ93_ZPchr0010g7998 [Zizania palustris]
MERFLALASRLNDPLSERQQVQLFIAGLQDDIGVDVELQKPANLQEAMSVANPLGELKRLSQTGSVETNMERFLALAGLLNDPLSDRQQVHLFIAGLQDDIGVDVELQKPANLQEAMSVARDYEKKTARQISMRGVSRTVFKNTAPAPAVEVPQRQLCRLSPIELAKRRKLGLCYNCNEKFVRGHKCTRSFYIDCDSDEATNWDILEEQVGEPHISLNALSGIEGGNTMRHLIYSSCSSASSSPSSCHKLEHPGTPWFQAIQSSSTRRPLISHTFPAINPSQILKCNIKY